ncbi:dihydrofolate reductase family protein [Isoptericola sp. b515]|uniref:dihydrofolate reductase family protein n=1 Tax=Isoptericola sp. b515 TaxID=3064652 RepID=UPI002712EFA3|nr:dihydrofolate reductase family protein [Isoptericola sp. b515]MDO8147615.1 dihydrofolate reductase family protein [Isoptericola sp. b515]
MHTIVAVENVSLDGVMQAPAGPDEDPRGGFTRGGWATPYLQADPEAATAAFTGRAAHGAAPGGMLFGHRTYDDVVGYWLTTTEPNPFSEVLRESPKYVATRDPDVELAWPASFPLVGEATQTVARLREQGDGDLVVLGSGALVRDLAAAGLVDRYVLTTLPVVLGQGTRLFGGTPLDLEVRWSTTSPSGIVTTEYAVRRP